MQKKRVMSTTERKPSRWLSLVTVIGGFVLVALMTYGGVTYIQSKITSGVQQVTERSRDRLAKIQKDRQLQNQQAVKDIVAQRRVNSQQPRYEEILIKGKSARECMAGNVISNATIECTKDHLAVVPIGGKQ